METLKIAGEDWIIDTSKTKQELGDLYDRKVPCLGMCDPNRNRIFIAYDQSKISMERTLVHEVLEAIIARNMINLRTHRHVNEFERDLYPIFKEFGFDFGKYLTS